MKPPRPRSSSKAPAPRRPVNRRGVGADTRPSARKTPTPGWKGHTLLRVGWRNPRLPSVPATLELNLDEYYTAATLMGLIAGQVEEPSKKWCRDWAFDMGAMMAREAKRRRRSGGRR